MSSENRQAVPAQQAVAPSEREKFEAWLPAYWPRETYRDDEGEELFCDSWVQGAWMGWLGRANRPTPPAVVEPLKDEQILTAFRGAKKIHTGHAGWVKEQRIEYGRAIEAAHGIGIKKGDSHG